MIELTEVKIKELIAQKKAELDKFVVDVNTDIARRNGEIAALTSLINDDPPAKDAPPPGEQNGKAPTEAKSDPPKEKEGRTKKA